MNWCPELGTVLANEEVQEQQEKGFTVVRKQMKQWMLRVTKYADRLLYDLEKINFPSNIKEIQRNWIGRSEGALVCFKISGHKDLDVEVFTTRPDTIFGATYIVLAPENKLVERITTSERREEISTYIAEAAKKSELERTDLQKDKNRCVLQEHML